MRTCDGIKKEQLELWRVGKTAMGEVKDFIEERIKYKR